MRETPPEDESCNDPATGQGGRQGLPSSAALADSLAARLQAVIGRESVSSFARRCGLAESVLRTYLKDGRMPPLDKASAIAAAAGVTVDWLATGSGAHVAAEARAVYAAVPAGPADGAAPTLDATVLATVLETVLETPGAGVSTEELAARVVDLYRRAMARAPARGQAANGG